MAAKKPAAEKRPRGRPPKVRPPKAPPQPKQESGHAGGKKGGKGRGLYEPSFAVAARTMCRMGAIDQDLAEAFGVSLKTIQHWRAEHEAFAEACAIGKAAADDMVEKALFRRATGYEHTAVKIMQYEGAPVVVDYVEHYPPDTGACIFWLKNRRRKDWKDKWDVELTDNTPTGELLRKARERRKRLQEGKGDAG